MRREARFLGFGLFLITLGVVLLAVRQGWVPTDVAARAWQLWPLLLVAGGLSLLLSGRPGAPLGGLVAAVCLGVIVGGLIGSGSGIPFVGCGGRESGTPFAAQGGGLSSTATMSITFQCGDLTVGTQSGSDWAVTGSSRNGIPPTVESAANRVRIAAPDSEGFFGGGNRDRWTVLVPESPTLNLDLTLNAGSAIARLDGAHLDSIDFTVNAGSLELDLREAVASRGLDGTVNAGSAVIHLPNLPLDGGLTVNAGSLVMCAPEGVGLRLNTGGGIVSSNDFEEQGLVEHDDAWETPGFATAEIRITLDVQANAGSLSLNQSRSCAG